MFPVSYVVTSHNQTIGCHTDMIEIMSYHRMETCAPNGLVLVSLQENTDQAHSDTEPAGVTPVQ